MGLRILLAAGFRKSTKNVSSALAAEIQLNSWPVLPILN